MISKQSGCFLSVDNAYDYVPFVSTLSSSIDLFKKYVLLNFSSKQFVEKNHYYTQLKRKSIFLSIILLIPVIGNLTVFVYDLKYSKYNERDWVLANVGINWHVLENISDRLKNGRCYVVATSH